MTTRNPLWPNGCDARAPEALRFLANNDRPSGGEQFPNAACLLQLADELEAAAKATMPPPVHPSETAKHRIFPPVPAEAWVRVEKYPIRWLGAGERLVVMIRDDEGNVGRAFGDWNNGVTTWWHDHGPGAPKEQVEFEPTEFSFLPERSRWACRTCFRPVGGLHVPGCPQVESEFPQEVVMGDTPPIEKAELAPVPAEDAEAGWPLRWAEGLIAQLPEGHDGRDSWLLNHGKGAAAERLRREREARERVPASLYVELIRAGYEVKQLSSGKWRWSRRTVARDEPFALMMVSPFASATEAAVSAETDLRLRLAGEPPSHIAAETAARLNAARVADGLPSLGPIVHRTEADAVATIGIRADETGRITGYGTIEPVVFDLGEPDMETVPVNVGGVEHRIKPGPWGGAALYAALDVQPDRFKLTLNGQTIAETDTVLIRGGERFHLYALLETGGAAEVVTVKRDPAVGPGEVVVTLNGVTKAIRPGDWPIADLRRELQIAPMSGLSANAPGSPTVVVPDEGVLNVRHGDAFSTHLCETRFSGQECRDCNLIRQGYADGGAAEASIVGRGAPRAG